MHQRLEVDRQLDAEDRRRANYGRGAGALMHDQFDQDDDEILNMQVRQERMRNLRDGDD